MSKIGLIFPHQLFASHPVLEHCHEVYLIEDSLFFGDRFTKLNFHTSKLVFHRASMKAYESQLKDQGVQVHYIEYDAQKTLRDLDLDDTDLEFFVVDPTDFLLEKRLKESFTNIHFLESPLFINTKKDNENYLETKDGYFMHSFYQHQRKRLGILIDEAGKPKGGSWSYDSENRKRIPKRLIPELPHDPNPNSNAYVTEARTYVGKKFPHAYGSSKSFWYPVSHSEAQDWFMKFLEQRFEEFGDYEDAMVKGVSVLYHSVLSPLLNVGLLDPRKVVEQALTFAEEHNTALNSVEGFVRQIIGWREFIRMLYEHEGVKLRNSNAWKHTRPLSKNYWSGHTGIQALDESIRRILDTGYAHHIERLMLHGNFMFLTETHPHDVYRWFMEMFIDSYDWVMVPNVYGMTQQSCKGIMTTKPYISGSNYVLKMSNYQKGPWCDIWDALYWSFIIKHREALASNGRMHFVTSRAKKFSQEQINNYEDTKKAYLESQS